MFSFKNGDMPLINKHLDSFQEKNKFYQWVLLEVFADK